MGEDWYRMQGIEVVDTDRGGRVTYHGPGQLVAYPIVEPARARRSPTTSTRFVRRMERAMIAALGDFGVEAGLIDGLTGVWVGASRRPPATRARSARSASTSAAAISTHGLAINVNNDLQPFEWVVPCGIEACRMTSLDPRARRRAGPRTRSRRRSPSASARPTTASRSRRAADEVLGSLTLEYGMSTETAERIHVTRSRANPGGATGIEGRPFRERKPPWLKVPAPGGPTYRS